MWGCHPCPSPCPWSWWDDALLLSCSWAGTSPRSAGLRLFPGWILRCRRCQGGSSAQLLLPPWHLGLSWWVLSSAPWGCCCPQCCPQHPAHLDSPVPSQPGPPLLPGGPGQDGVVCGAKGPPAGTSDCHWPCPLCPGKALLSRLCCLQRNSMAQASPDQSSTTRAGGSHCWARPAWDGAAPWDTHEGSAQPVPPVPVSCSVPAHQVRGHCRAEGQDKAWSCRMAVPSWARALGSGGDGAGPGAAGHE